MVITGLTRNQVVLTGSWVRIPPAPPSKNPVTMRVSGFFLFCARSKNHPILGCSFHNFGKNSFSLYSPLFSALCSHLLPKSPASGRGIPLTIACAEGALELDEVVPEGSKPMAGSAWAAGRRLKAGDRL